MQTFRSSKDFLSRRVTDCLLWTFASISVAVYFALDWSRWWTYDTGDDFGLFFQSMSDPSGQLRNAVEGSHFANHFSPIYDLLAPFVQISHSVALPMFAQVSTGAIVTIGLYRLALRRLPASWALSVSSLALFYAPLVGVLYGDPYETSFAPAITVWLFVSVIERRWWLASFLVALLLCVKEDQALFLGWDALLCVVWGTRTRDMPLRNFATLAFIASLTVGLSFVLYIRPLFSGGAPWKALLLATTVPASGGAGLSSEIIMRLPYIVSAFLPLAFLPLIDWKMLLFVLPPFAEVVLAPREIVWTMGSHYAGVWVGYILLAWVFAIFKVYSCKPKLAGTLICAALILSILSMPFVLATGHIEAVSLRNEDDSRLDQLLANDLPRDSTIGVTGTLYAHLWENQRVQLGVNRSPCFALYYAKGHDFVNQVEMMRQIRSGKYGDYATVWSRNGLTLYERCLSGDFRYRVF